MARHCSPEPANSRMYDARLQCKRPCHMSAESEARLHWRLLCKANLLGHWQKARITRRRQRDTYDFLNRLERGLHRVHLRSVPQLNTPSSRIASRIDSSFHFHGRSEHGWHYGGFADWRRAIARSLPRRRVIFRAIQALYRRHL